MTNSHGPKPWWNLETFSGEKGGAFVEEITYDLYCLTYQLPQEAVTTKCKFMSKVNIYGLKPKQL